MARHALGVLGVIAAGVLLAVSAAMNYRFGFSLGKTAMDGQIYGLASAAADCFKALVPFFLFAAIRNRMWSQALAAALVWAVVTAYSMTSALGHAALNRLDTTGQRAADSANYKDLRADSKRAQDQLAWIPAHRPAETVPAEINVLKAQRLCRHGVHGGLRQDCARVLPAVPQAQRRAGLGAAGQEARGAHLRDRRQAGQDGGGTVMAEADPQASVLAKMTGLEIEKVQTALTIFVALLIEIGSAFGMYVAFAYWRIDDRASGARHRHVRGGGCSCCARNRRSRSSRAGRCRQRAAGCRGGGRRPRKPPAPRRLNANDNRLAKRACPTATCSVSTEKGSLQLPRARASRRPSSTRSTARGARRTRRSRSPIPGSRARSASSASRRSDRQAHALLRHRAAIRDGTPGGQEADTDRAA